jgi:hypothetical protein
MPEHARELCGLKDLATELSVVMPGLDPGIHVLMPARDVLRIAQPPHRADAPSNTMR